MYVICGSKAKLRKSESDDVIAERCAESAVTSSSDHDILLSIPALVLVASTKIVDCGELRMTKVAESSSGDLHFA